MHRLHTFATDFFFRRGLSSDLDSRYYIVYSLLLNLTCVTALNKAPLIRKESLPVFASHLHSFSFLPCTNSQRFLSSLPPLSTLSRDLENGLANGLARERPFWRT